LAKPIKSHSGLLKLLQKKEKSGGTITLEEILDASGWKEVSFKTYLKKGQLSEFLQEIGSNIFQSTNTIGLSVSDFSSLLSQSKHRRELGYLFKSGLAKALLRKSRDNMLLAMELYNRPSLENRLDGFVLCFCVAWEQLLKAVLIEGEGEESIYKTKQKNYDMRETISLRDCLKHLMPEDSLTRKNIEKITFYRDQAVHLLMPEVQSIISRLFQSGIINYGKFFQEHTGSTFLGSSQSGMISLVGDLSEPSIPILRNKYGKNTGDEVINLIDDLKNDAINTNNIEFSIPINVKLTFAKKDDSGNLITLSKADDGIDGLQRALIVEKPVDRHNTHPFREHVAIEQINRRLLDRYTQEKLKEYLIAKNKETNFPRITTHDFRAIIHKLKWKKSNNKHHYLNKDPVVHYYSDTAIEEIIQKIMDKKNFLRNTRESYKNR